MRYVVDSSALLLGIDLPEGEFHAPPGVLEEVRSRGTSPQLEAVIANKIRISEPSPEDVARIEGVARETGDLTRLSPVDVELLALALSTRGTLLTDDYSIQNVAEVMGLPYRGLAMEGIRRVIRWRYRCSSCLKRFDEPQGECPVCGGPVKSWPAD